MVKTYVVCVAMNYSPDQAVVFGENACLHWPDFWSLEQVNYSSQSPTALGMLPSGLIFLESIWLLLKDTFILILGFGSKDYSTWE